MPSAFQTRRSSVALLLISGIGFMLPLIAAPRSPISWGGERTGETLRVVPGLGVVGVYYLAAWQMDRFQRSRL